LLTADISQKIKVNSYTYFKTSQGCCCFQGCCCLIASSSCASVMSNALQSPSLSANERVYNLHRHDSFNVETTSAVSSDR
ncbi:MAG TPA: hypothetical protein VIQ31_22570, partial [Phormidium sp.]